MRREALVRKRSAQRGVVDPFTAGGASAASMSHHSGGGEGGTEVITHESALCGGAGWRVRRHPMADVAASRLGCHGSSPTL